MSYPTHGCVTLFVSPWDGGPGGGGGGGGTIRGGSARKGYLFQAGGI